MPFHVALPSTWIRAAAPALVLWLVVALCHATAPAQCAPYWLVGDPVTNANGEVTGVTTWDPDGSGPLAPLLIAHGRFTVGTLAHTRIAAYDGTKWSSLGTPPAGEVTAVGIHSGWLVAAFTDGPSVAISSWNGIAWQSLAQNVLGHVQALTDFRGDLIAGGLFTNFGGVAATNVARWNGSSWSAMGSGVTGVVNTMVMFSNLLYVGGRLSAAGIVPLNNLAIWNGSAWSAAVATNGEVRTLAARIGMTAVDSYLFVGGTFDTVGTGASAFTAYRVVRFYDARNTWSAMGNDFHGYDLYSLFVRDSGRSSYDVIACIDNGPLPLKRGAWRWNGASWDPLSMLNLRGFNVTYFSGQYVLGTNDDPALLALANGYWEPLSGPNFRRNVQSVLDTGSDFVIGGGFGIVRGTSGAWKPLGTGVSGTVWALARSPNGDIIAGGSLAAAGGAAVNNIARWDGVAWSPLGVGVNGTVRAILAQANGDLIVGGEFTMAGGNSITFIARWNGSAWSAVGGGVNNTVHALAHMPNGDVIAGGDFTLAGSFIGTANRVARWDGSTWSSLGAGAGNGLDDGVHALAVLSNGELIVGGQFLNAGGINTPFLARWNGATWAGSGVVPIEYLRVRALAPLPGGDLAVVSARGLGRLHGTTWSHLQDDEGGFEAAATTARGELIVGGTFQVVGNVVSTSFARMVTPCPASAVSYGSACSGSAGMLAFQADELPWLGGSYRATASGFAPGAVALDLIGIATPPVPLAQIHVAGRAGCSMLVNAVIVRTLMPVAGRVDIRIPIPVDSSLVGATVSEQLLQLEVNSSSVLTSASSTNGLTLRVGSF